MYIGQKVVCVYDYTELDDVLLNDLDDFGLPCLGETYKIEDSDDMLGLVIVKLENFNMRFCEDSFIPLTEFDSMTKGKINNLLEELKIEKI